MNTPPRQATTTVSNPIRLQKWLAKTGYASRHEADRLISSGQIWIDGVLARPGMIVEDTQHKIELRRGECSNGDDVVSSLKNLQELKIHGPAPKVYWMLNKPDQYLVSTKAQDGKSTIFSLPALKKITFSISPVGRLDFRTEGLLLLSNDGELVHRLMHPSFKIPRVYHVLVNRKLSGTEVKQIESGSIELADGLTSPCTLRYYHSENLGKQKGYWYSMSTTMGRNRIVRRIFESIDVKVVRLIRVGFGNLELPYDLRPGAYRQLTSAEIKRCKELVGLKELKSKK